MKYAVIKIKGKQYKVEEGDKILIDNFKDKQVECEVLLLVDGEKVLVGDPLVKEAKIKIKIVEPVRGKKIDVLKYKAKSRYRKAIGFRPMYTKLLVEKIG